MELFTCNAGSALNHVRIDKTGKVDAHVQLMYRTVVAKYLSLLASAVAYSCG